MSDMRHIVIGIKIRPTPLIKQVMLPPTQQHDRFAVAQLQIGTKITLAPVKNLILINHRTSYSFISQVQQGGRVRTDRIPELDFIGICYTRPIIAKAIDGDRELNM